MQSNVDSSSPAALAICDAIAARIQADFTAATQVSSAVAFVLEPSKVTNRMVAVFPISMERADGTREVRQHDYTIGIVLSDKVSSALGIDATRCAECQALLEDIAAALDGLRLDALSATVANTAIPCYLDRDALQESNVFLGSVELKVRRWAP